MSYQLKIIKENPLGFWPLTETSGLIAYDISGCGNHGAYVGSPVSSGILPLVPGGGSGTRITDSAYITLPITKDFYASDISEAFGTKYSSDNDFTIECWVNQSIESLSITTLMGSATDSIGLFWENGDIVFRSGPGNEVRHPITYSKKSAHLVGIYSVSSMSLYVDGVVVASKEIATSFKFQNESLSLSIGPTSVVGDEFIIDAPCVYRYSLSANSILRHYYDGNITATAIQVVSPDEGILFSGTDATIKSQFEYTYPKNKSWTEITNSDTYYDPINKYITFYKTENSDPKSLVIEDFLMIPSGSGLATSKIEWRDDIGIVVETSVDNVNWQTCTNGMPIPQYSKDSFSTTYNLYFKITMSTSDASKKLPRLSFFAISFYNNKDVYSDNSGYKILSTSEYYLGSLNYPVLSRNYTNGIRTKAGNGFYVDTEAKPIQTIEMMFTPSTRGANTLLYGLGTSFIGRYAWGSTGLISKAGISKIYINGVDKTTQTNVSNFLTPEEPHHIVIVLTAPIFGQIKFNYQTTGGPTCLYKNLALYAKAFTSNEALVHYNQYVGKPSISISESVISLTESTPVIYNNDWIVLQST